MDLCGYTNYSIAKIFHSRVTNSNKFFGYSGTIGGNCHDYIITDKHILPSNEFKNFSESVIYLPDCFLPNQLNVKVSKKKYQKKI